MFIKRYARKLIRLTKFQITNQKFERIIEPLKVSSKRNHMEVKNRRLKYIIARQNCKSEDFEWESEESEDWGRKIEANNSYFILIKL